MPREVMTSSWWRRCNAKRCNDEQLVAEMQCKRCNDEQLVAEMQCTRCNDEQLVVEMRRKR
jgi:hypothetical protein